MKNKFRNLFNKSPVILFKIFIIIILILVSMLLWRKQRAQAMQLNKIKEMKQLVSQIPKLKKQIEVEAALDNTKYPQELRKEKIEFVLKGIFLSNNSYCALINDKIYQKGGKCQDFYVSDINLESVILKNDSSGDVKTLRITSK